MNYEIEQILLSGAITFSLPPGSTDNILLAEANGDIGGIIGNASSKDTYPTDNEIISLYYILKGKTEKIRSYLDRGLQVKIGYKNSSGDVVETDFNDNSDESIKRLDDFISSIRRWAPARIATEAEMLKQLSSYDHPSMGRIPKSSAYSTEEVRNAANEIVTSARRANEAMLGDQEVSMQIGYLEFAEDELGPDSVFITDINEVSTISSLRSRTDIALKGSGGRNSIEVDIIFKDKDQINTKFRELNAMLKMAPIVPIGGSVFAAAIINRITASKTFEKFKQNFYSQDSMSGRRIEELVNQELRANSDPSTGLTEELLKDIIKLDRSALEYMIKKSDTSPGQDARTVTDNAGAREVNTQEIIPESLRTLLVSVVFDSMAVSTIAAMPGAIRVRLTFMRHHDITSDTGDLMFIDGDGNPTNDIRKCLPLKKAVELVYLNPSRKKLSASNKNQNESDLKEVNPDYISTIGDKSIVEKIGRTVSGNLSGIDISRVHTSEMGHNLYQDVISSALSPVLFKFSTTNGMGSIIEYVPWRMVLSSVTWTLQNKIAMIPMQGQLMPAVQMMGRGGVTGAMTFMTSDRSAVQEFMTVKASMDEISTSKNLGQLLRREFTDIYNDVLNMSGSVRFILSSATVQTSPDNPNLFMISIQFVSNEETIEKTEKLSIVQSSKPSVKELEELWWWLYGGLIYNYEVVSKLAPGKLLEEYSGVNNSFTRDVSETGRRFLKKPTSVRNSLSNSISSNKEKNQYTAEELKIILQILKGFTTKNIDPFLLEKESVIRSGLVERNMFVAAVTEMVRNKRIGPVLKEFIKFRNATDDNTVERTVASFIQDRIVALSNICENGGTIGNFDDDLDGPLMFKAVFDKIISLYTKNGLISDPMFITKDSGSELVLSRLYMSIYNDMGGYTDNALIENNVFGNIPTETADSKLAYELYPPGYGMGFNWVPTPALWQTLFNVMMSPGKYRTKRAGEDATYRGNPAGIHYPLTKLSTLLPFAGLAQGPIFYISDVWRNNKSKLTNLVNSPESRNKLPSFFADPEKAELYEKIGRAGFSLDEASKHNFLIDPEIFEKRNTYSDMGLPRYSEIFSIDPTDPDPKPRKTSDGFEIWRKVAPTYAELGESPNIFRSLTGLVHTNGKYKFTHPGLLTPRVFQDYCDPGFFYHKQTWINESYSDLLDEIKLGTTENTKFMPSGPGGAFKPGWEEIQKSRVRHQDDQIPQIILSDFDVRSFTQAETAAIKEGTRTVNELGETNRSNTSISQMIARLVKEQIDSNFQNTQSGIPSFIERVRSNADPNDQRFLVVDAQGTRIGMIVVDKKGEQTGSNSNINRVTTKGTNGNAVEIRTSDSSANSVFNGEDFKGKSITFIDMTEDFNKPADTKAYMSSTEMIKYNEYSKEDSAAILKRTFEGIGDQKINKARNYPAFRIYFVTEKVMERGDSLQFMSDDIYGYASVLSMDVMHDKEDASTAVITLTDITGVLSSSLFRRQIIKDDFTLKDGKLKSGSETANDSKTDRNVLSTNEVTDLDVPAKIILEVGTNIVVKMGYGQDPEYLKTVFTGAVAELQPGDVTTIIAQSYRTEMFKYINFYGSNGLIDSMTLGRFHDAKNWTHPIFLVHHILVKMAKVSGVESNLSLSGLPHFGRFMTMSDFLYLSERDKKDFDHEYNREINKTVPKGDEELTPEERARGVTNDIDASNNIGSAMGYGALGYGAAALVAGPIGWVAFFGVAVGAAYGAYKNRYKRYVAKYDDLHVYTNAMRNVMISESFETNFWNYIDQEWIADGSGWSCLKEVARYKVNHICSEVPYGNHATLFMGKPDNLYHYKPLDKKSLEYYEQFTPMMSRFVLEKLNENLLDPYLSSSDYDDLGWKYSSFDFTRNNTNFGYDGEYDYQTSLDLAILNKKIQQLANLERSKKFEYVFNDRDFVESEYLSCFKEAAYVIDLSTRALFPPMGEKKEPAAKKLDPVYFSKIRNSLIATEDNSGLIGNIILFSGIRADLFLEEGITANTRIDGNQASFAGFMTPGVKLAPFDRADFEKLGYSRNDLVAFRNNGSSFTESTIVPIPKKELANIGVSAQTGLPLKDVFILQSSYGVSTQDYTKQSQEADKARSGDQTTIANLRTISSYGNILNGLAVYSADGQGTIYHGGFKGVRNSGGGAKEIDFDFTTKNYLITSNQEPVIPTIDSSNIRITLIQDRKSDLSYVESAMKTRGESIIKTIFAYFFGLDYLTLESGSTKLSVAAGNTPNGLSALYGDLDSFAVEFTRALMEGKTFTDRLNSYRKVGDVDRDFPNIDNVTGNNERDLRFFNVKLERMCRSYLEDQTQATRDMGIYYGQIKAKSVKFDLEKAKKLFTDNLVESVNQGFLTQSEIQSYIANSKEILDIASAGLKNDKIIISPVESAASSAVAASELQGGLIKTQISANDADRFVDIVINNANKYKLFIIYLAKFLRNNPDVAAQSVGISETLDWINEGLPPDQKKFRDTHVAVSDVDIVYNNIIATTSQMYNNILLFGPKDLVVESSSDSDDPNLSYYTIAEDETSWVPFPNFQGTSGVDFNPYVSPENRKQLQVRERNAETLDMKSALLINHLAEGMRPMYRGTLKIIGKHVKPYDLIYIADKFNHMFGFIEVERVVHNYSSTEGWTTTITPHAYVVPIDEVQMVARRFDTKWIEYMFLGLRVVDTALNAWALWSLVAAPLKAGVTSAFKSIATSTVDATVAAEFGTAIAAAGADKVVKNTLVNMIAGGLLRKEAFMAPFTAEARALLSAGGGTVTEAQVNKLAVQLLIKSSPDWMAKGEVLSAIGNTFVGNVMSAKSLYLWLGRDVLFDGLSSYANVTTQCKISSTTLPIHVFCLLKSSRVYSAGLDTKLSRFYNYGERLGYSMSNASAGFMNTIYELFTLEDNQAREKNVKVDILDEITNNPGG